MLANLRQLARNEQVHVTALVFCCFLLTSTGWLMWMERLAAMPSPISVEFVTLVCSYLVQACGIGIYMVCAHTHPTLASPRACACATALYVASLVPAVLSPNYFVVLLLGAVGNALCGILQGFYLSRIAALVETDCRGTVFGIGYAAATLAGWALDKFAGGVLMHGLGVLAVCGMLAALTAFFILACPAEDHESQSLGFPENERNITAMACLLVVLVSLTSNLGYGFPHADLLEGVDLASSRLFYGAGLVVAGIVSDRNRIYGMLCCACSLIVPLLSLALAGAKVPATVLWAVGYLLSGFFSVFRVTSLADIAAKVGRPELAGAGLMFGRVGDALGTATCLALSPSPIVLIALVCVIFAVTVPFFYAFLRRMASLEDLDPVEEPSAEELFGHFVSDHGLSERQTEVLRLLLDGRTNQQIASELVVSDNTVKFHVRNVLQKTGCKNRAELRAKYDLYT